MPCHDPGGRQGLVQGSRRGQAQEDSYFIAISDMLIGLIFLFIIMLMAYGLEYRTARSEAVSAHEQAETERDQLALQRDAVMAERARLQARLDMLQAYTTRLEQHEGLRDQLLRQLEQGLAARGIDVAVELEKGVLRLPEALLFPSGSAELKPGGVTALGALAEVMGEVMPCYVADARLRPCREQLHAVVETVLIEGHTDDVPIANELFADNWALSVARGTSTFKALTAADPMLDSMRNARGEAILGVSGYETRRPVAPGDGAAARERNRRIDLRFLLSPPMLQDNERGWNELDEEGP